MHDGRPGGTGRQSVVQVQNTAVAGRNDGSQQVVEQGVHLHLGRVCGVLAEAGVKSAGARCDCHAGDIQALAGIVGEPGLPARYSSLVREQKPQVAGRPGQILHGIETNPVACRNKRRGQSI